MLKVMMYQKLKHVAFLRRLGDVWLGLDLRMEPIRHVFEKN